MATPEVLEDGVRKQLVQVLFDCVRDYLTDAGLDMEIDEQTLLMGRESEVDSLGLVMIVTSFEDRVNELFEGEIVLANEKAMSMTRSPFRSVAALSDYAGVLLKEAGKA